MALALAVMAVTVVTVVTVAAMVVVAAVVLLEMQIPLLGMPKLPRWMLRASPMTQSMVGLMRVLIWQISLVTLLHAVFMMFPAVVR